MTIAQLWCGLWGHAWEQDRREHVNVYVDRVTYTCRHCGATKVREQNSLRYL